MGNYGIKISQKGYNAESVPDRKLIFSSSWPLFGIKYQGSFSSVSAGGTIFSHNLDYVPMFWVFTNERFGVSATTGISTFNHVFNDRAEMDSSDLKVASGGPGNYTGRYFIFAIDLETAYTAPSIDVGELPDENDPSVRDYGLKVTIPGKDTSSTDLRDYSIHSGTRSPMLHSVTPGSKSATPNTITVEHDLGYAPMFMIYAKLTAWGGYQIVGNADDSYTTSTSTEVSMYLPYEADYSIVILKDPLFTE